MEDFSVGQVLFILMNDENQVLPVHVIERVTRETSSGQTTQYIVSTSDGKKLILSKINGIPYSNIDDLRGTMISNVTRAIDNIISRAESVAKTKLTLSNGVDIVEKETLQ